MKVKDLMRTHVVTLHSNGILERFAIACTKSVPPLRQAQDRLRAAQGERTKLRHEGKTVRAELVEARTASRLW